MKKYLKTRLNLIYLSVINTIQRDTAYLFNNWGNFVSGTIYLFTALISIGVVFSNTELLAGYSKNQMLFFILISQFNFYLYAGILHKNLNNLVTDINTGKLDLILVKPVPSLFFLSFRSIDILTIIRDYLVGVLILIFSINWNDLNLLLPNLVGGAIIFVLGFIIASSIHYMVAMIAFWIGESSSIFDLSLFLQFDFVQGIPLEGWRFNKAIFFTFTTILPFLISTGLAASVMLNKSSVIPSLIVSILLALIFLTLKNFLWKLSLRNYTSASS